MGLLQIISTYYVGYSLHPSKLYESRNNKKVPESWKDENLTNDESEERLNLLLIVFALTITLILLGFFIKMLIVISILDRKPEVIQPTTSAKGEYENLESSCAFENLA